MEILIVQIQCNRIGNQKIPVGTHVSSLPVAVSNYTLTHTSKFQMASNSAVFYLFFLLDLLYTIAIHIINKPFHNPVSSFVLIWAVHTSSCFHSRFDVRIRLCSQLLQFISILPTLSLQVRTH